MRKKRYSLFVPYQSVRLLMLILRWDSLVSGQRVIWRVNNAIVGRECSFVVCCYLGGFIRSLPANVDAVFAV